MNYMQKQIAILSFILIAFGFAKATQADISQTNQILSLRLYGLAEQLELKGYLGGQQLLKESGPLYGAGGEFKLRLLSVLWLEGLAEYFFGDIDCKGDIPLPNNRSLTYKSETEHQGLKFELNAALLFPLNSYLYLKPYGGVGTHLWRRTFDTKLLEKYIDWDEYIGDWFTLYWTIGCEGGIALAPGTTLFGKFAVQIPIDYSVTIETSSKYKSSDVKLKPGKSTSYYVECGLNIKYFTLSAFYETIIFSISSSDNDYYSFFLPKTDASLVGAKLGLVF